MRNISSTVIINALFFRELKTRFGSNKVGYLWAILEPLAHILILSFIFSFTKNELIDGIPYYIFIGFGIILWFLFVNTYKQCINAISSNKGLLHYKQVKKIYLYISRAILEYVIFSFLFMIFMTFVLLNDIDFNIYGLGFYFFISIFISILGLSLAILINNLETSFFNIKHLVNIFLRILYFSSAIFYSLSIVPNDLIIFFMINPMVNFIELARLSFFDIFYLDLEISILYIFTLTSFLFIYSFGLIYQTNNINRKISNKFIFKNLKKSYQTKNGNHIVFDNASFEIPVDKNIAVLGKNGSGKSTFTRILSGIEDYEGEISYNLSLSWSMGLSGGFQGSLTGFDNSKFIARINGLSENKLDDFINKVKEVSELESYFYEPVKTYSSGMKARLAFSLSILFDFDYYLIDEIISVGDKDFRKKSLSYIEGLLENKNFIIVSHDLNMIKKYCHVGIVIKNKEVFYFDDINKAIEFYTKKKD